MIKKSGTLIFLLYIATLVAVVVGHNYFRYYVERDYPMYALASCDPKLFNCFEIDPLSEAFIFYTEPYIKVDITANVAPTCIEEHTCTNFTCSGIESECNVTYCSNQTREDSEICSNIQ